MEKIRVQEKKPKFHRSGN
nr:unnamed protein product [Callosobruchus chinensis]